MATPPPPPDPAIEAAARQRTALMAEQQHLKRAYETIMGLPPDQFELKPVRIKADRKPARNVAGRGSGKEASGGADSTAGADAVSATPPSLPFRKRPLNVWAATFGRHSRRRISTSPDAPVSHVIAGIKRQWQDVSQQLAPYQAPAPAKVFRVGAHLFAVQDGAATTAPGTGEAL